VSIKLLVKKLIHGRNIDQRIFLWYTNKSNEYPLSPSGGRGGAFVVIRGIGLGFKKRGSYANEDESGQVLQGG